MNLICVTLAGAAVIALVGSVEAASVGCAPDAVRVGPVCVDRYEGSTWQIPAANKTLIRRVQQGKATLAALQAGGATQLGCNPSLAPYPATFPDSGNWTEPVYATSVAGVLPSTCISWFQAEQACALSGKRLLTNQEWQRAAAGTPEDASSCNTNSAGPTPTGSLPDCVSRWGAFDMVGNVDEYVADWVARTLTSASGVPAESSQAEVLDVATLPPFSQQRGCPRCGARLRDSGPLRS
jgi:formylglycine-generating enzyme required for sulfatase activity